jgi:hypothetical protein
MKRRIPIGPVVGLAVLLALPAWAGNISDLPRGKVKKLSEQDRVWLQVFDVFMQDAELELYLELRNSEDRMEVLKAGGYMERWRLVDKDFHEAIRQGKVLLGMGQEEVYMAWNEPAKIRKTTIDDAYVEILLYRRIITRKGELEWEEGHPKAYNNAVVEREVVMGDDKVLVIWDENTPADERRLRVLSADTPTGEQPEYVEPDLNEGGLDDVDLD